MNLHDPRHPWARLTAAARTVQDDRDTSVPYGFATRVTAIAFSSERKAPSLFDAFALRALGIAALLALSSVVLNYSNIMGSSAPATIVADATVPADEIILPTTDVVAVVLDIAD